MTARRVTRSSTRRPRIQPRIAILPYGGSDSATALKNGIVEAGPVATKLRLVGSAFRGRFGDLIVNWGNSTIEPTIMNRIVGDGRVINRPEAIKNASDKIKGFRAMSEAGVPTVEWTLDRAVARQWLEEGCLVYARTRLTGHSGAGIVMAHQNPESIQGVGNAFQVQATVPAAALFTKGLTEQRREFRIHVMNGIVI
ncbi:MAG: hypothetical protein ACRDC4_15075, partial [Plesiomonas sp.]